MTIRLNTQMVSATLALTVALVAVAVWTQSTLGANLLPHAFCITGSAPLLVLHIASDGLIALAYMLIPAAIANIIVKRKDLPFGWIAWLFGAFIVACGATHAVEVWTLWDPVYWYSGVLKAFTAGVSLATAWALYMLTPQILAIPSASQLRASNAQLLAEVDARRQAEAELSRAKIELERLLAQSSAEARHANALLNGFFDGAPSGLALLDHNGRLLRANAAFYSLHPPAEVEARGGDLPARAAASEALREPLAQVVATGTPVRKREIQHPSADGSLRPALVSLFPIGESGHAGEVGCVMEDITYQRQIEQERQQALTEAQQARDSAEELNRGLEQRVERRTVELTALLTELEAFSSSIAHDLRAPLTTISGFSQMVLEGEGERLSEQGRRHLGKVKLAVAKMDEIISALLYIARLPHQLVNRASIDIADIARSVNDDLQAADPARRCELSIAAPLPAIADPVLLRQVLANLIGNSWKFSARREVVRIEVGTTRAGNKNVFFVRDEGDGFDMRQATKLFEMFYRVHSDNDFRGSGIGLAIVKRIIRRHGGEIWADAAPGEGATFYFTLPDACRRPCMSRPAAPRLTICY